MEFATNAVYSVRLKCAPTLPGFGMKAEDYRLYEELLK